MLNDEEATRAIRELNGAVLNGNRLNVEVCTCDEIICLDYFFVSNLEDYFILIYYCYVQIFVMAQHLIS